MSLLEFARPTEIRRVPMSWEDFLKADTGKKDEWVDGEWVMMPPPVDRHEDVAIELLDMFRAALPGIKVGFSRGVRTTHTYRVPDVHVRDRDQHGDSNGVHYAAIIAVEILSPSTRSEDLYRKPEEYLSAGVAQCWIIDPDQRTIDVRIAEGGQWHTLTVVDPEHPEADIPVAGYGSVPLRLDAILPAD
jgi:Uma2 family endonuclease